MCDVRLPALVRVPGSGGGGPVADHTEPRVLRVCNEYKVSHFFFLPLTMRYTHFCRIRAHHFSHPPLRDAEPFSFSLFIPPPSLRLLNYSLSVPFSCLFLFSPRPLLLLSAHTHTHNTRLVRPAAAPGRMYVHACAVGGGGAPDTDNKDTAAGWAAGKGWRATRESRTE